MYLHNVVNCIFQVNSGVGSFIILAKIISNFGNLVVYVAQTAHRFAHRAKCVQRCQTYLFVSNKRKFTIKITGRDFNYTIILCARAPLPPIVSKQS
jgi:hypothetical protein